MAASVLYSSDDEDDDVDALELKKPEEIDLGQFILNNPFDSKYEEAPETQLSTGFLTKLRQLRTGKKGAAVAAPSSSAAVGEVAAVVDGVEAAVVAAPSSSAAVGEVAAVVDGISRDGAMATVGQPKVKDVAALPQTSTDRTQQKVVQLTATDKEDGGDFIRFDDFMPPNESTEPEEMTERGKKRSRDEMEDDNRAPLTNAERRRQADDVIDKLTIYPQAPVWFAQPDTDASTTSPHFYTDTQLSSILNREMKDFERYISPTDAEHKMRQYLIKRIEAVVYRLWPHTKIEVFGSFETKLYLPSSDLDMVILGFDAGKHAMFKLKKALMLSGLVYGRSIEVIHARVPIIKFVDSVTQFRVDISFGMENGVRAAKIMNEFMAKFPALRPLGLALKQFLVMRGLNEVFSGGLGSYGLVSIITSFLQMHPKIQVGFVRQEDNLGVLLMEFFELYGKRFNYDIVGIDIRHSGEYFLKHKRTFEQYGRENAYDRLCVQDPEDETNDITRGSFNIRSIRAAFGHAYDVLCGSFYENEYRHQAERRHRNDPVIYRVFSILGTVIDIQPSVIAHREHVEDQYKNLQSFVDLVLSGEKVAVGSLDRLTKLASEKNARVWMDDEEMRNLKNQPAKRGQNRKATKNVGRAKLKKTKKTMKKQTKLSRRGSEQGSHASETSNQTKGKKRKKGNNSPPTSTSNIKNKKNKKNSGTSRDMSSKSSGSNQKKASSQQKRQDYQLPRKRRKMENQ